MTSSDHADNSLTRAQITESGRAPKDAAKMQ